MDSHAKNVCLIGVLHILSYIVFALEPLIKAIRIINSKENEHNLILYFAVFGFYVLVTILAGLMMRGVVKQRHLLVAPFLIFIILVLAACIIMFLIEEFQGAFYFIEDSFYPIAVQILILYPIYTLFVKLRKKSLKEKSLAKSTELLKQT
ncbi:uncharacterized protein LOC135959908 [Calliphora vicina]|uniref:uncharacterized protein LOC135959908 n=1 Tax=Calliphora vicina TaxID=7373 RepID=UPI00325AAAFD